MVVIITTRLFSILLKTPLCFCADTVPLLLLDIRIVCNYKEHSTCMCMCVRVMCVCMCAYVYVGIWVRMSICICVDVCLGVHICIYV